MIDVQREGGVAVVTLHHRNPLNPFSVAMTRELIRLGALLEADASVTGVLVWGGAGRSFSVGGDFAEIRAIQTPQEFEEYLRDIVRSYQALLALSKPVVAAIDGHAIGQGLQVALMTDWRIGSDRSVYQMPELANGVPCPLGSAILEALLGRADMLHLVVGCAKLGATEARAFRLLDEVVPADQLEQAARERLATLCRYPGLPYRSTKRMHNARLATFLTSVSDEAARIHAESFFSGNADAHFTKILDDKR